MKLSKRAPLRDLSSWAQRYDVKTKPWLLIGKGPSYKKLSSINLSDYYICTLNHVIKTVSADLAHIIDMEVIIECADDIYANAKTLVMPVRPHVRSSRTKKVLTDFFDEIPVLQRLHDEGRLYAYHLKPDLVKKPSKGKWRSFLAVINDYKIKPVQSELAGTFFSAEAALNMLVMLGASEVRSVGVDGGNIYSDEFMEISPDSLLKNGQGSFDIQFKSIAKTVRSNDFLYAPYGIEAPVIVVIGAYSNQSIDAQVLEYSIKAHATITVSASTIELSKHDSVSDLITELCMLSEKLRSKIIYFRANQLVKSDVIELWEDGDSDALLIDMVADEDAVKVTDISAFVVDARNCSDFYTKVLQACEAGSSAMLFNLSCASRAGAVGCWSASEPEPDGRQKVQHVPVDYSLRDEDWQIALSAAIDEGFVSK